MPGLFSALRPSWVAFGWFIGAAVTAAILLALVSVGLTSDEPGTGGVWVAGAMALGFATAGVLIGGKVPPDGIGYGFAVGLFSLLVWVGVNLFLGEPTDQTAWNTMSTVTVAGLLLLQAAASALGVRLGARRRIR